MSIKIGSIIKDNDPRVGRRILVVESFEGTEYVRVRHRRADGSWSAYPKNGYRIRLNRIHTDSKERKSGYTLQG